MICSSKLVRRYRELKAEAPGCLLLMQVGAFYEHLPILRAAYDLAVHFEQIVRHFSRDHKYTLGTDLRDKSRKILEKIIAASVPDRRRGPGMRAAACANQA